ncbi:MAG: AMP-binding protein [Phycisphaeraceae bacterium]|nr:AMP-binding protein [Phycisphaerales bacterium]MCB9859054.1 AMP-binding protein [Phycisphaeraceae bacterium]
MSIHWPIIRHLLRSPRRVAVVDDRRSYRAIEILVAAMNVADEIERRCSTEMVGLMLPTSGAFPIAILGVWIAGKVPVPLNYLLKHEELEYVVGDCAVDTIITAQPMLDHLGLQANTKLACANLVRMEDMALKGVPSPRWPARNAPDDLGVLLYTSGTSGKPKGVMLTHKNISSNISQFKRIINLDANDCLLGVLPQFHSFGLTVLTLAPLMIGCKVVYTARFVPGKILSLIREHKPTIFVAIPSMYGALLNAKNITGDEFDSLRLIVSGGEPLSDFVAETFYEKFGRRINEGYGLTETSPVTHVCLPDSFRRGSVGRPLPEVKQRIVDLDNGRDLPQCCEGEIRLTGPNIMRGYYKLPDETAKAFDNQGWFRTGDIGQINIDGSLSITGRLKEMLIVGGENVFPRTIEQVIDTHPSVAASAVVGKKDDVRGEVPVAFVELAEGVEHDSFDPAQLLSFCRESLAPYMIPREVRVLDALPRNPTGKIMRRELQTLV